MTTSEQVAAFRENNILPHRLTLRFLALLTKRELAKLARDLKHRIDNHELPETNGDARRRRQWAQYLRVQSEREQRGYIK